MLLPVGHNTEPLRVGQVDVIDKVLEVKVRKPGTSVMLPSVAYIAQVTTPDVSEMVPTKLAALTEICGDKESDPVEPTETVKDHELPEA